MIFMVKSYQNNKNNSALGIMTRPKAALLSGQRKNNDKN